MAVAYILLVKYLYLHFKGTFFLRRDLLLTRMNLWVVEIEETQQRETKLCKNTRVGSAESSGG